MEQVFNRRALDPDIKGSLKITLKMVLEYFIREMGIAMKDTTKMGKKLEKYLSMPIMVHGSNAAILQIEQYLEFILNFMQMEEQNDFKRKNTLFKRIEEYLNIKI